MNSADHRSHIHVDEQGVAWIGDTNVKVIEVVLDKLAHGSSPEEIHFQYPHLSLAQIHAALSHYYDHEAAFQAQIKESLKRFDARLAHETETPLRRRLRAMGKLS